MCEIKLRRSSFVSECSCLMSWFDLGFSSVFFLVFYLSGFKCYLAQPNLLLLVENYFKQVEGGTLAPMQFQPCPGLMLSCLHPCAAGVRIYRTWAVGRAWQTPCCQRLQSKNPRSVCWAQHGGSLDLAVEVAASDRPSILNGHRPPAAPSSSRDPWLGSSAPSFALGH